MKKIIIPLCIVAFILIIFIFNNDKIEHGAVENISKLSAGGGGAVKSKNNSQSFSSSLRKKTMESDIGKGDIDQKDTVNNPVLVDLLESIQNDHEKCEGEMNNLFGPEDSTPNLKLFTDFEIKELFKKFNQISFNSPQMTNLMVFLSENKVDLKSDAFGEINNVRPCRMFQKINFLDEVRKIISESSNKDLQDELKSELSLFFKHEVETSSSVANLTMVLNMMEAFSSDSKNKASELTSKLDSLIDQIEEEYEDILISAEEGIDSKQDDVAISRVIIKKELEINKKYKQKILDLIKENL